MEAGARRAVDTEFPTWAKVPQALLVFRYTETMQALNVFPDLEGQGDLVSRLIKGITGVGFSRFLLYLLIPPDPPSTNIYYNRSFLLIFHYPYITPIYYSSQP